MKRVFSLVLVLVLVSSMVFSVGTYVPLKNSEISDMRITDIELSIVRPINNEARVLLLEKDYTDLSEFVLLHNEELDEIKNYNRSLTIVLATFIFISVTYGIYNSIN